MEEQIDLLIESGRRQRLPSARLREITLLPELLNSIPLQTARTHRIVPLRRSGNKVLLACEEAKAIYVEDFFSRFLGCEVLPVIVSTQSMDWALQEYYEETAQNLTEVASRAVHRYISAIEQEADAETPVARLVQHTLVQAVRMRASDIHLEPGAKSNRLRYRIDGVLVDRGEIPAKVYEAVISRIKITAQLDIAEKRRPQDGRALLKIEGKEVDLRVSIMPALDGEGVVIRVLGGNKSPSTLDELLFPPQLKKKWLELASASHGIVLVTGPTGSGKTSTLYGTVRAVNSPGRKILTLEEPVEARLDGILQIPIRSDLGFTFESGLRSALRHDPDVMLVGEIRDRESAEIGIAASLTGHLLFSTLHTNNSRQAITRLLDMGLQEYKVLTALQGVLAQRLMRRLCEKCKRPTSASEHTLDWEVYGEEAPEVVYQPVGCEECNQIGYCGRVPIFELLEITPPMRSLRGQDFHSGQLEKLIDPLEFKTLAQSARERVRAGLTSINEYHSLVGG